MADFKHATISVGKYAQRCFESGEIPTVLGSDGLMALIHQTASDYFKKKEDPIEAWNRVAAIAIAYLATQIPSDEELLEQMDDDPEEPEEEPELEPDQTEKDLTEVPEATEDDGSGRWEEVKDE